MRLTTRDGVYAVERDGDRWRATCAGDWLGWVGAVGDSLDPAALAALARLGVPVAQLRPHWPEDGSDPAAPFLAATL